MSLVLGRRLIGSHAERGNQYVHQKWDPGTIGQERRPPARPRPGGRSCM